MYAGFFIDVLFTSDFRLQQQNFHEWFFWWKKFHQVIIISIIFSQSWSGLYITSDFSRLLFFGNFRAISRKNQRLCSTLDEAKGSCDVVRVISPPAYAKSFKLLDNYIRVFVEKFRAISRKKISSSFF